MINIRILFICYLQRFPQSRSIADGWLDGWMFVRLPNV